MKIQSMDFICINGKQDNAKFVENTIITARLIEADANEVLLELSNGIILSGKTDLKLQGLKDTVINFLIKSFDNNRIELKPLFEATLTNEYEAKVLDRIIPDNIVEQKSIANAIIYDNSDELPKDNSNVFIKEILKLYKLEENNISIETIRNMMNFEMPLSKESVKNVMKYINKLDSLISTSENEKLYLLESSSVLDSKSSPLDSDIFKIIKTKENKSINPQNISGKLEIDSKNIADEILLHAKSIAPRNKITPDIIKKVVFLLKSEIHVSINSIKQLTDLVDKENSLEHKIIKLFDELDSSQIINKSLMDNLKSRINNTMLTFSSKDKEKMDTYYKEIKSILDSINKQVFEKNNVSDDLSSKIKDVNDSINLINKLNEHTTFIYLPFTCKDVDLKNSFYMLSKKKRIKSADKISVFLRLETKNLEKIEVMCTVINNRVNLSFKVESEFVNLFEENKLELSNILEAIGYSSVSIAVNKKNNQSVLDLLSNNEFLNYKINIKV